MHERDISPWAYDVARNEVQAETTAHESATPLADEFEVADPVAFELRIESILPSLAIIKTLGVEPNIEHPMLRGLCVAQLERDLEAERKEANAP